MCAYWIANQKKPGGQTLHFKSAQVGLVHNQSFAFKRSCSGR